MSHDDNRFADYFNRHGWVTDSRFMQCLLHYAVQREGQPWSQVVHRSSQERWNLNEKVVLIGEWGRYRRLWKSGGVEVHITEDYEANTCTAIDSRNLYPSKRCNDVIITVPTNEKMPDMQALKLLDAVAHYLAGIRQ